MKKRLAVVYKRINGVVTKTAIVSLTYHGVR